MKELSSEEYLEERIIKAAEKLAGSEVVRVVDFLCEMKVEPIFTRRIMKFPHDALFNAILLLKIKRIKSQSELGRFLKANEEDSLKLGFCRNVSGRLLVSDQRTLNHFINKVLDKNWRGLIDSTVKRIEALADKYGIIFDVEVIKVSKPKSCSKTAFNNRKKERLDTVCRFLRQKIYPQIKIEMHHNARYKKNRLLDVLLFLSKEQSFAHDGAKRFEIERNMKAPDSDTLLYHLKKYDIKAMQKMFMKAFHTQWKIVQSTGILYRNKYDVAIDFTEWFFYGKNAQMVVGKKPERGTTKCYKFATITIVEPANRFTLLVLPVGRLDSKKDIVMKLLDFAEKKIKINRVYCDRGFFSADVINVFKQRNLTFLMPATENKRVAQMLRVTTAPKVINNYPMSKGRTSFNLVIVEDKRGKKAFATNIDINANETGLARYLFGLYSKRWGIETSYRMQKEFLARTTSKNYKIRLFYFLFSVLLYDLWVLADAIISKSLLNRTLIKHLITQMMFAVVLMSLCGTDT